MSSIQYYHRTKEKVINGDQLMTVAVDVPDRPDLVCGVLRLNIGRARVHPNDQYRKKIGREISKDRMSEELFFWKAQEIIGEHETIWYYQNNAGNTIAFKISSKSDKVWFILYVDEFKFL